jgi:hypothetical protein
MALEPLHTKIEKTIPTIIGMIILENYFDFPSDISNLYCIKENGDMVWQAETPEPRALYTRVMLNSDGYSLLAYANTGHACEIELSTGKLIRQFGIV